MSHHHIDRDRRKRESFGRNILSSAFQDFLKVSAYLTLHHAPREKSVLEPFNTVTKWVRPLLLTASSLHSTLHISTCVYDSALLLWHCIIYSASFACVSIMLFTVLQNLENCLRCGFTDMTPSSFVKAFGAKTRHATAVKQRRRSAI